MSVPLFVYVLKIGQKIKKDKENNMTALQNRLSLLLMAGLLFAFSGLAMADDLRLITEKSFAVSKGEKLKAESYSGDIKVSAWEKDEVAVKIYGDERAEKIMEFYIEKSNGGVMVKIKKEGKSNNWFGKTGTIRVEIRVPASFDVTATTAGGDISINGVSGELRLNTAGGDIKTTGGTGELKANTAGGDIIVKEFNGDVKMSTAGGDIRSEKVRGDVDASTAGGDINLQCADGKVNASTSGGDIRVDFSGNYYGIKASTTGGDVAVRVPKSIRADIYASTFSGDIDCEFDISNTNKYGNAKAEGSVNGGGEKLKCTTTGGDIKIAVK
ncbi:MAG: hypothetical protein FMNOHCHN_03978 [Ignavibacteriaceae bacterium]|nr:hypothetical protein [Ignavibacteriaceae bacterium]